MQGLFYSNSTTGSNPLDVFTDGNGSVIVDSLSKMERGGIYLITAYLMRKPSVKDTVTLYVQVPGLTNLKGIYFTPTYYPIQDTSIKENIFTFYQTPNPSGLNHPSNDWCIPQMANELLFAIANFYYYSMTEEGGENPITISLNDACLEYGGIFDFPGQWSPPHKSHRLGRSIDINDPTQRLMIKGKDSKTNGVLTPLGEKLNEFLMELDFHQFPEPASIHYDYNGN
jgi:hypothetical protein